ncbi:MAG: hypothetical protein M3R60_03100 [Pseudomonadota bacterium]|nr:hypothetical protein [Pseudomonadota bacterium]
MPRKPALPRPRPAQRDTVLRHAMAAHQAGRLDDAERGYRSLLPAAPNHPDALHYLGVLVHQRGRRQDALPLIERAPALAPG